MRAMRHFDRGGPYEREYADDGMSAAGGLADISDKLHHLGAPGQALSDLIKQFGAGALSQIYGVDRDTGEVGVGKGGVAGIGAINDTKGLGALWSDLPADDPRNPGYQSMRMQDALRKRMRLPENPDMPERLMNMAGAIAGQVPTFLMSEGASLPAAIGSTLSKAGRVLQPIADFAGRAPSMLKKAGTALNYGLESLTPMNNVGIGPRQLLPAAAIGEGVSQGINTGVEQYYNHELKQQDANAEAEKDAVMNDPRFQQALADGDRERAMMIAHQIVEQFNAR